MAVNTFSFHDFLNLFGKEMDFEELRRISFDYGMEIETELEDDEFSVEVTPERPDIYSVEGYARALRAFNGFDPGLKKYDFNDSNVEVIVDQGIKEIRPFIGAAIIKNVSVDDHLLRSIIRFQEKLHFTLGRKRKKIAIGIYDLDKIVAPVYYNAVDPNSVRFVPLESTEKLNLEEILEKHPTGIEYKHLLEGFERYPLLVDSAGNVLSFPPIINSNYSGKVTEKTKNLFVEVTGTHEPTLIKTVNMLTTSLADRGGKIERVKIKYPDREIMSPVLADEEVKIDLEFINKYLGIKLRKEQVQEFLLRMGYDVRTNEKTINVTSPCYRVDVLAPCDVVEDIAIAYGYSNFEFLEPHTHSIGKGHPREEFANHVREVCGNLGLNEVMTLVLTSTEDQYSKMRIPHGVEYVSLLDSKSAEHHIARLRVIPELLKFLRSNKKRETPISIFEVGDVVRVNKDTFTGAEDIRTLSIAEMGANAEFSRIRSFVSGVFDTIGLRYDIQRGKEPYYLNGRCGDIYVQGDKVGNFGEVHPQVLNNFALELPVVSAEIDLDKVSKNVRNRL